MRLSNLLSDAAQGTKASMNVSIHTSVLSDADTITTPTILAIMSSGMANLTSIQQDLLGGFFLQKIQAPMRSFKAKYGMSSGEIHAEVGHALSELQHHFKRYGIARISDFA